MKKEIHRMELRYEQLRKKQEQMIKDMERAVFKRETIQLKYLPKVEKKNAQDKCKINSPNLNLQFSISGQVIKANSQSQANSEAHNREHDAIGHHH